MQITIYNVQIRDQRFHNVAPRFVQALIPYCCAIYLQPFTKYPTVFLDGKGAVLNHLVSKNVLHEVDFVDEGENVGGRGVLS